MPPPPLEFLKVKEAKCRGDRTIRMNEITWHQFCRVRIRVRAREDERMTVIQQNLIMIQSR